MGSVYRFMSTHRKTCAIFRFSDRDNRRCSCGKDDLDAWIKTLEETIQQAYRLHPELVFLELKNEAINEERRILQKTSRKRTKVPE